MATFEELSGYAQNPNVRRFLDVISAAEGTDINGYNTAFGGGRIDSLADHPRQLHSFTQTDGTPNKTSAAGRYQFLGSTWDDVAGKLGLSDFGPQNQDVAAVELLRRNGALPALLAGDFDTAVQKSGGTWASLPSSPYAQPKRSPGFIASALDSAAKAIFPAAQAAGVPQPQQQRQPTAWKDVIAKPEFQALSPEQQAAAQAQYFDQVVAPRVPQGQLDAARGQFMQQYGQKKPEVSDSSVVALGAGLGKGVGTVALNAQRYLGRGINAVGDFFSPPERNLSSLIAGQPAGGNAVGNWLVQDADQGLKKLDSEVSPYREVSPIATGAGEIGGNIAATAPAIGAAGGLLGMAGRAVPGLAPLGTAVGSAGLRSGGLTGASGLATRTAGGALAGGLSAGLVDPESAGEGAIVGGLLPGLWTGAAKASGAAGKLLRGPTLPETARAAAQTARQAGYVLPPSQVQPSLVNRVLEGVAGKLTTAQQASARNQEVTNQLVRNALGVAPGTQLSDDLLNVLRRQAGGAYQNIRTIGAVEADDAFRAALDGLEKSYQGAGRSFPGLAETGVTDMVASLRQPRFDAGDALDAIAVLRDRADRAFRSGDNIVGKASKGAAGALEDMVARAAEKSGDAKAVEQFRRARESIAKTYTVQKALNSASGNVNARKIGQELQKGRPLSGDLRTVGEVANAFPKATQAVEQMGSLPGVSPLDIFGSVGLTALTQNPLAALSILGRPLARSAALSGPVQNRLAAEAAARQASPLLSGAQDFLAELAFRSAPLLSSGR